MERQKKTRRIRVLRPAFTLVELLVVITIIGMLVALLIPAISVAKEHARRLTCANNQHQLGLAVMTYAQSKNGTYPGWRANVTGAAQNPVSWVTLLLPNLERNDLWQMVKTGGSYTGTPLRNMSCPSDPPINATGTGQSAYTINGLVVRDPLANPPFAPQTQDYVSNNDGTTTTLLISENTQLPPPAAAANNAASKLHNWYDVSVQINQTFGVQVSYPGYGFTNVYNGQVGAYNNVMLANMNSNHSGGTNVTYCDGHGGFLSDTAGVTTATGGSIMVYQVLVTPDGTKNGEPPADESQIN